MAYTSKTLKDGAGGDFTAAVWTPGRDTDSGSQPVALSTQDKASLDGILARLADLIAGRAPVDTLGQPTVARQLAVTSTTSNVALTVGCRRISIRARGCPMRYAVGSGAQTADGATSHFIDLDERLDISVPASTPNIAAIAIAPWGSSTIGTGSLAITELG